MARDEHHIAAFLDRIAWTWHQEPDQRFGQLVGNLARWPREEGDEGPSVDDFAELSDEGFLTRLDEHDAWMARARAEAGREEPRAADAELGERVVRTNQVWDRWALRTFGRIDRDPKRIGPFLRHGAAWKRQPELTLGELTVQVIEPEVTSDPWVPLWGAVMIVEDEDFLGLLEDRRSKRPSPRELLRRKLRRGPPEAKFLADLVESLDEEDRG